MHEELVACLRATRANRDFRTPHGESYHSAACAAIQLDDEQRLLLKSSIDALASIMNSRSGPSAPENRDHQLPAADQKTLPPPIRYPTIVIA